MRGYVRIWKEILGTYEDMGGYEWMCEDRGGYVRICDLCEYGRICEDM
jgi:hypothetical protein